MKKNNQRLVIAAATVLVVAVIFTMAAISWSSFLAARVQLLVMENADTHEVYLTEPLDANGIFSISYTHSVNKSMVEEYYQLKDQQLMLIKARYHHFGAGVATEVAPGQEFYYDDEGYMVIDQMNQPLPSLVYKVGTVSDHILHIGDKTWHLKDLAPSLTSVRFSIITK